MGLSLSVEAPARWNDSPEVVIAGVWVLRSVDRLGDGDTGRSRKGKVRAFSDPTRRGCSWRIEMVEQSPELQDDHPAEALDRGMSTPLTSFEVPLKCTGVEDVGSLVHRQVVSSLKQELERRYGPLEELHVLFDQVPAPLWSSSSHRGARQSWWHRLWRSRADVHAGVV